jgi:hypothetical protein
LGNPLPIRSTSGRSITLPLISTPATGRSYKACRDWIESRQIHRVTIPQALAAIYIHRRSICPRNGCPTPTTFTIQPHVLPPTATGWLPPPDHSIHMSLKHLLDAFQRRATILSQPHSINNPCNTFPRVAAPPQPVMTQALVPSMVAWLHQALTLVDEEGCHEHAEDSQRRPTLQNFPITRHLNHRSSLPVIDKADVARLALSMAFAVAEAA